MKIIWLHGGEIINWRTVWTFARLQCFYILTSRGGGGGAGEGHAIWKSCCYVQTNSTQPQLIQGGAPVFVVSQRQFESLHKILNLLHSSSGIVLITGLKMSSAKPTDVIWINARCSWECVLVGCGELWPLTNNSKLFFCDWMLLVERDRNIPSEFHGTAPLWWWNGWMMEWWHDGKEKLCVLVCSDAQRCFK